MSYTLCIGLLLFVNVHVKHSTITLTSSLGDNAFTVITADTNPWKYGDQLPLEQHDRV